MNLFNYLMNKNGKILVDNNHMLEYLLNKSGIEKEASGTEINITDVTKTHIIKLTLDKESIQDGTPTSTNPIEIETVKDNVEITVTNGTTARNYNIPLGDNEICGIGDYKDELIVDSDGHCYINKKIGKSIFDGMESGYSLFRTKTDTIYWECNQSIFQQAESSNYSPVALCNYLKAESGNNLFVNEIEGFTFTSNKFRFSLDKTIATSVNELKTWISSHNLIIYGLLKTENIIDLNYIVDIKLFKGTNNITNSDDMNMSLIYK